MIIVAGRRCRRRPVSGQVLVLLTGVTRLDSASISRSLRVASPLFRREISATSTCRATRCIATTWKGSTTVPWRSRRLSAIITESLIEAFRSNTSPRQRMRIFGRFPFMRRLRRLRLASALNGWKREDEA